jgi:hypothetical protein
LIHCPAHTNTHVELLTWVAARAAT